MRIRVVAAFTACVSVLAAGCVPPGSPAPAPGPLPPQQRSVEMLDGTVETLWVEVPDWVRVRHVDVVDVGELAIESGTGNGAASLSITSPLGALGEHLAVATLTGCLDDACGTRSRQMLRVEVVVTVVGPGAQDALPGIAEVDPTRWDTAANGDTVLPDEVSLLAVPGADPGDVSALVDASGAGIVGGVAELGIYRARVLSGDAAGVLAQLRASELISGAEMTTAAGVSVDRIPDEWSGGPPFGAAPRWSFEATGAPQAWASVDPDAPEVELGVVDIGLWAGHSDLASQFGRGSFETWGPAEPEDSSHGTHVAGTMCAAGDGSGVVGVMWGCTLHGVSFGGASAESTGSLIAASDMLVARMWDWLAMSLPARAAAPRVVNMSFGIGTHGNNRPRCGLPPLGPLWQWQWRTLFSTFPETLFVASAGNCGGAGAGVDDALPASVASSLPNVVSVSATAHHLFGEPAPLAVYSSGDGDIAAPGGDGPAGPWGIVSSTQVCHQPGCERWGFESGTSMAAPFVTGTAGLMLAANPSLGVDDLVGCLLGEANATEVTSSQDPPPGLVQVHPKFGLRELRVDIAVECALGAGFTAIDAGFFNTCASRVNGSVACWGDNQWGTLGDGSTTPSSRAVTAEGIDDAVDVTVGFFQACALRGDRSVWCWGGNGYGAVGNGSWDPAPVAVPVAAPPEMGEVAAVDAGFSSTCALTATGDVWCWGANLHGELGDGSDDASLTPVKVVDLPPAVDISVGQSFACARTLEREAWCWGFNGNGELGDGSLESRNRPAAVIGLEEVYAVTAGEAHGCAVLVDGRARCWGLSGQGRLGNGSVDREPNPVPVEVAGIDETVAAQSVVAGTDHTCIVGVDSEGRFGSCWGDNWAGQTGDGLGVPTDGSMFIPRLTPTRVALDGAVRDVSTGFAHTCAVLMDNSAWCWGFNTYGQVGDGSKVDRFAPVRAGGR